MATRTDLELYQGDNASWIVNVRNDDGTPADITGYTAKSQIRRAPADVDGTVLVNLTATVASPLIELSIPSALTALSTGTYVWDLQLTDLSGRITTILYGTVRVRLEVTR